MRRSASQTALLALAMVLNTAAAGPDPVPTTAEQAFDAVTSGVDPVTGIDYGIGKIVLVDVRTRAEYPFQGTAGKVDSIHLKGETATFVPDAGKATLTPDGRCLEYVVDGERKKTEVDSVAELIRSSIAVNIPCATWNEDAKQMDPAPEVFTSGIAELADDAVEVLTTMCNAGGPSTACLVKFLPDELAARFKAFHEVDRAGDAYLNPRHKVHLAGLGGFQGSVCEGVYNGYSGFVGRRTEMQPSQGWNQGRPRGPSVSWKDSGLPIFVPETSCNLPEMSRTP